MSLAHNELVCTIVLVQVWHLKELNNLKNFPFNFAPKYAVRFAVKMLLKVGVELINSLKTRLGE
jgi:hypothetical protein